ncbi:hypothetical protein KY363_05215 [Candidatus Woesearchaeota archaeon]|nr:hypothetical protein [Candidatus Woesearchaeota archaeon]
MYDYEALNISEQVVYLFGGFADFEGNVWKDRRRPNLTLGERTMLESLPDAKTRDIIFSTITRPLPKKDVWDFMKLKDR